MPRAIPRPLLVAAGVAVAAIAVAASARAQERTPPEAGAAAPGVALTLDSVYTLVAARNPRALGAAALARATAARIGSATRPADPELQLAVMNYMLPTLRADDAVGMNQLQLMQMVPLPGKLAAAGSVARARSDAATARALDATWDARTAAAMAFYERHEAGGRAAVARETRRLLEDVAAVAHTMYGVGDGRQTDVLRARVELARMDEDIVRLAAISDAATARLAAIADTPAAALAGAVLLPTFPDSVPSLEVLEQLAFVSRPALAASRAEVEGARAGVTLARLERWPDVKLALQYGQRPGAMETDRMVSMMVGATLPVFARARQSRMRDEAEAMHAMADAELASARAETRGRIAEVYVSLTSTRRLAALYRTSVLPQSEAATASALASYRTGSVDFMTVVDNRLGVNRFRQELIALEAAEGRAWAELEMLVGRPLITSAATAPRAIEGGR